MNKKTPYILIIPIVLLGVLFIFGVVNGIVQSLGYIPAFGLKSITLDYYISILKNPIFLDSLKLSLQISIVSSILAIILGTILTAALVYTNHTEGRVIQVIKLAILVPYTIVALFLISILSQNGLMARAFYKLGWISSQGEFPLLLYSKNNFGIILGYVWKEVPFVAYFSLSLMNSVNKTLGEASENLGASKLKSFFYITLPLSMPAIRKAFLIILTFSFGAYDLPFLIGATLPKALPVQAHIQYIHPDLRHRPYAMALNGLILLITWIMAFVYYLVTKKKRIKGEINEKY
ncbi:ABC transporter permease [Tissierella creatinophila]|uniref:Spermidine/putrescine transport system permease protein PotB n=1 Tax=Tissierella creatinophila DSM 6911 TaxID=1123403 RepID=A0A1U7M691_TISCR|nr:ABC transporter permease subunit [Tissierella creatinophila]OLS02770.1 spermidine/putrescine transport system permease protein PotB [Tissierella creatinophila DSM 6911]